MTKTKTFSLSHAALTAVAAIIAFAPNVSAAEANVPTPRLKPAPYSDAVMPAGAKVGIARIEEGRLRAAPFNELRDWASMSLTLDPAQISFAPVSPVALARFTPTQFDSSNKIDEIRLAAAEQGMSHVIIYGRESDARWNSFGGMALDNTGLTVPAGHRLSPKGKVKALIVGTYSGTIYGTVTSQDDESLGELTMRVKTVLSGMSPAYLITS